MGKSVLTYDQKLIVYYLVKKERRTYAQVAALFGISPSTISNIIKEVSHVFEVEGLKQARSAGYEEGRASVANFVFEACRYRDPNKPAVQSFKADNKTAGSLNPCGNNDEWE